MYTLSVFNYTEKDLESNYTNEVEKVLVDKIYRTYKNEKGLFISISRALRDKCVITNASSKIKITDTYMNEEILKFTIEAVNKSRVEFNIIVITDIADETGLLTVLAAYVTLPISFNIPQPPEIPISRDIVIALEDKK